MFEESMSEHYLDNSATTKVLDEAAQKALILMTEEYGNPSSLHTRGFRAKLQLDEARSTLAKKLGCESGEVSFTSGGTEANNLAILGAARANKRAGNKIVTTSIEHSAVLEPMKTLEREGFEIVRISPESDGNISAEKMAEAIDERTILVSMMLVNNETGAILPVKAVSQAIKRAGSRALLHTDAVQGFCKLDFTAKKLGADLITVSGHKVHAPKGVGAIYASKTAKVSPLIYGGGQEKGLRPGTEALPLIAAFAEAVRLSGSPAEHLKHVEELNAYLRAGLKEIDGVAINSPDDALPYVLNISTGRIKAETMLHHLASSEVYVSSGSACGKVKPSHVLEAMGLPRERVASAIRISFSRFSSKTDVDALLAGLKAGMETLAHA